MKRISQILFLILLGLVIGAGITEFTIRIFHLSSELQYEPNAYFGWGHTPGSSVRKRQQDRMVEVTISTSGLRDYDHEYAKPSDVFRILVLGDSFAEAVQVPLEDSFPRLLDQSLNAEPYQGRQRVEVINAGTSGYGTDNELLFFRQEGKKYRPDLVLLEFCLCNDVRNNWYELENQDAGGFRKPYFTPGPNGLVLNRFPFERETTWLTPVKSWLNRHMRLYPFLREARDRMMHLQGGMASGIPLDYRVYLKEYPESWEVAWRVTRDLLRELNREVTASGSQLFVMMVPTRFQVRSDDWKQVLALYSDMQGKEWELDKPNRLLRDILEEEGISYVDLLQPFQKHASNSDVSTYLASDGHWNVTGHQLAAKILTEELKRLSP